jgi:16S rRNA (adenine1518-N6/adenine1519-N6)-dimethyltransferase
MRQPLGQHFLHDGKAVKTILAAAELKPTDTALEIGPGKGVLTEGLVSRVRRLVAVELDSRLAEKLKTRFASKPSAEFLQLDFLKADLNALFAPEERPVKVLGNLPYSITSPIFEKLMAWPGWDLGVFLIQREVAERIASPAGSRAYGILTLAVQLFAEVEIILQVPPGAFSPPPKVSSTVVRLRRKKIPEVPPEHIQDFFDLAHGAFAHRRKTIANSLALFTGQKRANIENWLCQQKISAGARAETIALKEYAQLAVAWSIYRREMNLTSHAATSTILRT